MTPLNALVFGLGLFFIGLHLVGDNLKALSGGRFRDGIARTTRRPLPRLAVLLTLAAVAALTGCGTKTSLKLPPPAPVPAAATATTPAPHAAEPRE